MRLHRLALPIFLGLFFCFSPTSARASYTWSITTPTTGFSVNPGGTLAVGGSIGWTFGWDSAVYNVEISLSDSSGHENSTWANCNVGYQSTSFTGTASAANFQTTNGGMATLTVYAYDSNMNYLNGTAYSVYGTVASPPPAP